MTISLDFEFKDIVDEYGWWMVLRSFNLTKRSSYWNEASQEAIGGPPWLYNDIIFKGRRVEHIQGDVEEFKAYQQFTDIYMSVYYVVSKIRPKKEDILIEIPYALKHLSTPPKNITVHELFDIKHV